jgi:hypothetical protein
VRRFKNSRLFCDGKCLPNVFLHAIRTAIAKSMCVTIYLNISHRRR